MTEWKKNKVKPSEINAGKEFSPDDVLTVTELNAIVNNSFYGVDFAEAISDAPDISEIDGDGIPNVSFVDNIKNGQTYKKLKFSNLRGARGDKGEKGDPGMSGTNYDLTISNQSEFEAFYNSLDAGTCTAKSVVFVGDGGNLEFTRSDGKGLHIPSTLKRLDGINGAKISVTNLATNSTNNKGAIWYDDTPIDSDYCINNLIVSCSSNSVSYSFVNCFQLYNCKSLTGTGYSYCNRLVNCDAVGKTGFSNCECLVNCYAECLKPLVTHPVGFSYCNSLTNCKANVSSMDITGLGSFSANGFQYCYNLNNCVCDSTSMAGSSRGFLTCTHLSNCYGKAQTTNGGSAYVYDSCSFISSSGGTIVNNPSSSIWTGTNSRRDDDSCLV